MILDDNGLKHERLTMIENTSVAYIRMKFNDIFKMRLKEALNIKVLYFKA